MAKRKLHVFDVYWSPTGAKIATVEASTAKIAKSKAPAPYRKYKGEMYVEDRGVKENSGRGPKRSLISRKVRRAVKTAGYGSKARYYAKKSQTRYRKRHPPVESLENPPKMKRTPPKGWVKAKGVKIRRVGGRVEVLIRK